MSIWATFLGFDDGEGPPPIVYYGSHLFPTDIRDGSVDLALIPGFINPESANGADDFTDEDERPPHPFLRLSVNAETVVLDRVQVLRVYHALGDWLIRTGELPEVQR